MGELERDHRSKEEAFEETPVYSDRASRVVGIGLIVFRPGPRLPSALALQQTDPALRS